MTKRSHKIAAAVVLYNPPDNVLGNIERFSDDVDIIYLIDNSDQDSGTALSRRHHAPKTRYLRNAENVGVARALNIAAELAQRDGCDYLLTMDQDSTAAADMIAEMLKCLRAHDPSGVGIIAPLHRYVSYGEETAGKDCEEVPWAMTSGNLLNLSAYEAVGPFLDDLFIDSVDHEYCLRLRKNGYKIIRANNAVLHHNLGAITEHRFIFKQFALGNHPPLRRYYITRNKFFVRNRYKDDFPEFFRSFYRYALYELFTIILFESNKIDKLRMMYRGYRDYKKGVLGKYHG